MVYTISKVEILRRKKAYIRLSISLILGVYLASIIFNISTPFWAYILIMVALLIIGVISYKFFRDLQQIKIEISRKYLQRGTNKFAEKYILSDTIKIIIKWTVKKRIREIYLHLNNGGSVYFTALNDFEKFNKELQCFINKKVVVKEKHELIDYDHPLFYIILGLSVGGVGVLIFNLIYQLNYQYQLILLFIFLIYLISISIYLIVSKPIFKRVGGK